MLCAPLGQSIGFVVQRHDLLAALDTVNAQIALHLVRIENVQRAVQVIGEEVRHIDKKRNRPQPDRAQARLQPVGAGPVFHTTDQAAAEDGAAVTGIVINDDRNIGLERPINFRSRERLQRSQAACCEITCHAAHAQRVGAVRRDRNLDHGINLRRTVFGQPIGKALANFTFWQFDDAIMLFGQFQFPLGRHHAKGFDPANLANADGRVDAGDINAGAGDHDGDPCPRIRCAANNPGRAVLGLHLTHTQLVSVRMLFRALDISDREITQLFRRILDTFHFKTQIGQGFGDLIDSRVGFKVGLQPGQGEFHRAHFRQFGVCAFLAH